MIAEHPVRRVVTVTNIPLALMLAPGVAAHLGAWTGLPTIIAEGSLCLWLLLAGVDAMRWKEQVSAAIQTRIAQMEGLA